MARIHTGTWVSVMLMLLCSQLRHNGWQVDGLHVNGQKKLGICNRTWLSVMLMPLCSQLRQG